MSQESLSQTATRPCRPMGGRDPHEAHRVATPLELLFDLTFATAFSLAAAQLARALAEGHVAAALLGFAMASFAICWAWVNFSWFSSAYDTDDWIFRLTTMVQMIGVLIVAIGLPRVFSSIEQGAHLDNSLLVLGYVVMRVAMIFQWLRAAREDPARRRVCHTYAVAVAVAQIGWIMQIALDFSVATSLVMAVGLAVVEFMGPYLAERIGDGTPWHAHHIAERYSLFAIIALGEAVVGTVATLSAVIERQGWSADAALACLAGMGLTFGLWWVYSMLPSAEALHARRDRSFIWGYGQIVTVASIVATGAGLHVAAEFIERKAEIGPLATLFCVAVPVGVFLASVLLLYRYLAPGTARLRWWMAAAPAAIVALAVALAACGVDMAVCLVVVSLAPAAVVAGYERLGRA